jgi:hypothetical protein
MTTEAQLLEWKQTWRHLLSESLGRAFDSIEERLPAGSAKADDLLLLKAQLNEANRAKVMGVKSSEDLQLDYNRIRLHLLEWIDGLEISDFNTVVHSLKPKGRGVLLHKIPRQMEVGREEVCVIRLAYDRAVIADNLELTEAVEVKEVTVSEVMEAELIDANSEPAFRIRTYHDERQFLEVGAYTEWKFYVEPIREGTFRLLLKLTVIEEVMGARERRNITWEEQVQIVTESDVTEPATFRAAGVAISAPGVPPLSPTMTGGGAFPGAPSVPRRIDPLSPAAKEEQATRPSGTVNPKRSTAQQQQHPQPAPAKAKGRSLARRLSIAASVVLIVGFGGLYLLSTGEKSAAEERYPDEEVPGKVVEPIEVPVALPSGVRWSSTLSNRKLIRSNALPARPAAPVVFEVCVAASGEVVKVRPVQQSAADRQWVAQVVRSLNSWAFEPAGGEACGTLTYLPE